MLRSLCADDVGRLKAFGALQQIKLHGLTLVERAVTILLYRGEVHEYVFTRGALDKSISLRPVEPLHCTFLSHGYYSFHHREELFPGSPDRSFVRLKPPSKDPVNFRLRPRCVDEVPQEGKDSSVLRRGVNSAA
jgi:hypothetical protein